MARVLVLNDDQAMLDTYQPVLRELGHDPVAKPIAASGPETVREVGADVLVVDLQRPDEADYGLRIIDEIRAQPELNTFPIVLCTGAVEELVPLLPRLETLRIPVLRKPFEIAEFGTTLETVTDEAASRP